jgi:hypothetical protein
MFAVGHKQQVSDALTYQTFHDKMAAMMDATFPGRSTLVQAGVDDVASHLAPVDASAPANALVVFRPDATEADIRAALRAGDARLVGGPTVTDAYLLRIPDLGAAPLARLRAQRAVARVESLEGEPAK